MNRLGRVDHDAGGGRPQHLVLDANRGIACGEQQQLVMGRMAMRLDRPVMPRRAVADRLDVQRIETGIPHPVAKEEIVGRSVGQAQEFRAEGQCRWVRTPSGGREKTAFPRRQAAPAPTRHAPVPTVSRRPPPRDDGRAWDLRHSGQPFHQPTQVTKGHWRRQHQIVALSHTGKLAIMCNCSTKETRFRGICADAFPRRRPTRSNPLISRVRDAENRLPLPCDML